MKKKKLVLEFVNNGKPFELNDWTTEKHEQALDKLVKDYGEKAIDKQDRMLRAYIIYESLSEVDSTVKLDDIKRMHPDNQLELFQEVYLAGKKDIYFHEKSSKRDRQK